MLVGVLALSASHPLSSSPKGLSLIHIFSPNFPTNYWQFCRELKNDGMNVLGIGDQPYDELKPELKESLNEYYKVGNLENYDEV